MTNFQSCKNAEKGVTIVCEVCGYEKINDYLLEHHCIGKRRNHKWKQKA